jgi:A/G-specific adenine glycosylase
MLQQTQVARVEGYWTRFLGRYPTVDALAAASADAEHESWAGLGYYARARNLHAAAQAVVRDHDGVFPAEPDRLRKLPGIGRYTAAAVASIAFGADVGTVDTNVARVLGRAFGLRGAVKSAARMRRTWRLVGALVPRGRAGDGTRRSWTWRDGLHRACAALSGVPGRSRVPLARALRAQVAGLVEDTRPSARAPSTRRSRCCARGRRT